MTLSIFSCVFWLSVYLWRNIYLGLLFFDWVVCFFFFFSIELHAACIFWRLISCQLYILQIFSPTLWVVLLFIVSLLCKKLLSLIISHSFILFPLLEEMDRKRYLALVSLGARLDCLFEIFLVSWGKLLFLSVTLRTCFAVSHWFWVNVLSFSFVCGYF